MMFRPSAPPHFVRRGTFAIATPVPQRSEPFARRRVRSRPPTFESSLSRSSSSHPSRPAGGFHQGEGEGRLVLLRHGQSLWNVTDPVQGTTARFTGWCDVGLTDRGRHQSIAAGRALERDGWTFDRAYTSLLCRASDTMALALDGLGLIEGRDVDGDRGAKYCIPVVRSWRLNERHYGALVGLSKDGAERLYGRDRLRAWRDGWDTSPPPMDAQRIARWGEHDHCQAVTIIRDPAVLGDREESAAFPPQTLLTHPVQGGQERGVHGATTVPNATPRREITIVEKDRRSPSSTSFTVRHDENDSLPPPGMPASESLRDAYRRVLPLWTHGIAPRLRAGETVLVCAHANTIRSMLCYIDPTAVSPRNMKSIKIPSAVPLAYRFRPAVAARGDRGTFDGIVIPGNLVMIPSLRQEGLDGMEPRHRLSGHWIETDEIKSLSFCTGIGQKNLEHEIA